MARIPEQHFETDVLIIGGGAAGTMAAFACAEAGGRVIQATKGRATSGTTTVARGGFEFSGRRRERHPRARA